jgi:hypothetical protein
MTSSRVSTPLPRTMLAVALSLVAACGGGGVSGDQTTKFAGAWTFQSGSLTPMCGAGFTVPPFALTGLTMTLTKVDDSTVEVVVGSAGCTLTFKVAGDVATANPGQTCKLDVPALGGPQTISVTSWTLKRVNDQLTTDISAAVLVCTATGSGVLVPATSDAGTD